MNRLRLRVSKDPGLVLAQGATRRSFKPFAHAFGSDRVSRSRAALIVKSVNCHNHLVFAMKRVRHTAQMSTNDTQLQTRLKLVADYANKALARLES
jgi:hypothetical protein